MLHCAKFLAGCGAYPLRGRVRRAELGMRLFQLLQPPHQAIILGVGYLRVIEDVIAVIMMTDLLAECLGFTFQLLELATIHRSFLSFRSLRRITPGDEADAGAND